MILPHDTPGRNPAISHLTPRQKEVLAEWAKETQGLTTYLCPSQVFYRRSPQHNAMRRIMFDMARRGLLNLQLPAPALGAYLVRTDRPLKDMEAAQKAVGE